jgi:hypothetical protein
MDVGLMVVGLPGPKCLTRGIVDVMFFYVYISIEKEKREREREQDWTRLLLSGN